ncbi:MAG: hypothetical protein HKN07_02680 [Acidimicrobiia bacterium]|nr:hypothetical protein [Acidimicrobiia bacterium]
MKRSSTIPPMLAALAGGVLGGWIVHPSAGGVIAGLVLGLIAAGAIVRLDVRPAVALPILAGTLAGAFIGRMIVRLLCLPASCGGLEIAAAALTGIGALFGVGLVVVLVTRSFEEHQQRLMDSARARAELPEDQE